MSADSKALRRYHAGVERALGLFDATNEWADYIAFLSRLLKALQAAPPDADIPLKTTLAKYLAQCLTPALPSGVHQKTLEVYNLIFALLGQEGLSRDLSLYLPGISHTLSFASLSTRPWFLSLYEEHILKLPPAVIRPALKAIILSLLPGIEEENSEDFEKTLATFNKVRRIFAEDGSEEIFWQSLFLASITSSNKRTGVYVYLSRYLPRFAYDSSRRVMPNGGEEISNEHSEAVKMVTTPEPGILLRCFATGLQDEQPLVQRAFLDLLVSHLPLNASTLQAKASQNDLDILVSAAMSIVLRRDMSLNRRLWAWFTGSEEKNSPSEEPASRHGYDAKVGVAVNGPNKSARTLSSTYFLEFGLESVIRSVEKMLLKTSLFASERARPFRILLSLMDRWTIGGPTVDALFDALLRNLQAYQTTAPSQGSFDEVFRSANVFFDGVEPRLVASHIFKLIQTRDLDLVEFIIANFSLEENEMTRHHLPMLILVLSSRLSDPDLNHISGNQHENQRAMRQRVADMIDALLELLPGKPLNPPTSYRELSMPEDWLDSISQYYNIDFQVSTPSKAPLSAEQVEHKLMENLARAILGCVEDQPNLAMLDRLSSAFEKVGVRANNFKAAKDINLMTRLSDWATKSSPSRLTSFSTSKNIVRIIGTFHSYDEDQTVLSDKILFQIVPSLVNRFWQSLSPSTPQYHVESVELIWTLRSLSAKLLLVDSTIMSTLATSTSTSRDTKDNISNFAVFWTHTRFNEPMTPKLSNGNPVSNEDIPLALLRAPMLYILDRADYSKIDDPFRGWIAGLQTLGLFFQASLENLQMDPKNAQGILPALNRVYKLIAIARQSTSQWKDIVDATGPLSMILTWITSLVVGDANNNQWAIEALEIIRLVHEGAESPFNDTLMATLTQQIARASDGSELQTALLDTVQSLVGLSNAEPPPLELLNTLIAGIASQGIDGNIDKWITLLCNSIPLYSGATFFANLLKMTDCLCSRIQAYFGVLQKLYSASNNDTSDVTEVEPDLAKNPERSITNLFAGLEYILARAHTQVTDRPRSSSEVQGSRANEAPQLRSVANNRLTVILCMQDSIRVCGQVWFWRSLARSAVSGLDTKSFNYMSSRLRNKTRRMLEHLIDAEPQECLETLMGMWVTSVKTASNQNLVLNLLQTLDGARPKFMMPATFNAIYSRTNPGALDQSQKSSLSIDVTALELMAFLVEYIDALEDDLLEEIWTDCTTFLRDVLANPMPHRQILLRLLEFVSILCQKMENTNFGEESKMRRELADLCARLFTAIFTIKPGGLDAAPARTSEKSSPMGSKGSRSPRFDSGSATEILCNALPLMNPILNETDRAGTVYSGISLNMTGPILRSRAFPQNLTKDVLTLLQIMSKSPSATKVWRKDLTDAFNDPKFLQSPVPVTETGWLPLLSHLSTIDKTLLPDQLTRLLPPTTAGLMFGVGATAARTESDKRTQLTLRRITLILVASAPDTFHPHLPQLTTKIEDLLTATPSSSPSSSTRSDIFLLLRALTLSFAPTSLNSLWPIIDAELRALFTDMALPSAEAKLTLSSHLQGAKLLDLLLLLKPEEFQLHEWLFVTDTVDAVYPPPLSVPSASGNGYAQPVALADRMSTSALASVDVLDLPAPSPSAARKPWLAIPASRDPKMYASLLAGFFSHLSIHAFEDTYSLQEVDGGSVRADLLADLFCVEGEE